MKKIMVSNSNYHWLPKHQEAIQQYYWCYTAATSAETRQRLFNNVLYSAFVDISSKALKSLSIKLYNKDNKQDLLLFIYHHLLPRLKANQLQAVNNYIYIGCKRYAITNFVINEKRKRIEKETAINDDIEVLTSNAAVDKIQTIETKMLILQAIDKKIEKERIINKPNAVFLQLLRQYLIDNDFDAIGFDSYVMQAMRINKRTFQTICSRVRISTLTFKEKQNKAYL